jgi:hypothetical protein
MSSIFNIAVARSPARPSCQIDLVGWFYIIGPPNAPERAAKGKKDINKGASRR